VESTFITRSIPPSHLPYHRLAGQISGGAGSAAENRIPYSPRYHCPTGWLFIERVGRVEGVQFNRNRGRTEWWVL